MEFPLGEYVGNKYEVYECLEAMKEDSPYYSILDRILFDEAAVGNIRIEKLQNNADILMVVTFGLAMSMLKIAGH